MENFVFILNKFVHFFLIYLNFFGILLDFNFFFFFLIGLKTKNVVKVFVAQFHMTLMKIMSDWKTSYVARTLKKFENEYKILKKNSKNWHTLKKTWIHFIRKKNSSIVLWKNLFWLFLKIICSQNCYAKSMF